MSAAERPLRVVFEHRELFDGMIAERWRRGIDRRDEVWEGEYHVVPPADEEHGRIEIDLLTFLNVLVKRKGIGRIVKAGVREPGTGDQNFRVPEFLFLSNARLALLKGSYVDGGPDVVFEVRSPGDETYRKLDFYAARGVGYGVVIDRDSKLVEVFRLTGEKLVADAPAADGSLAVPPLGVAFRGGSGKLEIWDVAAPAVRASI